MRQRLGEYSEFQRQRRATDQVKRTVLLIGLKQAVEPNQRRQQRPQPKDRRTDPRQQVEVGPEREWDQDDDRQEEDQREPPPPPARTAKARSRFRMARKARLTVRS